MRGSIKNKLSGGARLIASALAVAAIVVQPLLSLNLPAVFAAPVISEVMPNPVSITDANGEWVEIHNQGSDEADVSGWTLSDSVGVRYTFAAATTLTANQPFVVCSNKIVNTDVTCDDEWSGAAILNNDGDTLTLSDGTNPVDSFAYESSDVMGGNSIEVVREDGVKAPVQNSTDNYDINGNSGTPGVANRAQPSSTQVTNTRTGMVYSNLQLAIGDAQAGDTLRLNENLTTSQQVTVNKQLAIDGNGFEIDAAFMKTDNDNNSALGVQAYGVVVQSLSLTSSADMPWPKQLHGINVYESKDVIVSGVSVYGFEGTGILYNSSTGTIRNVQTKNNGWHGINVDRQTSEGSSVTVEGTNTHNEAFADIYVDDDTKNVIVNAPAYNWQRSARTDEPHPNDRVYRLKVAGPAQTVMVSHNTYDGQKGWLFNRDTTTQTEYDFTSGQASIGNGSLYVQPIDGSINGKDDKFIGEYFTGNLLVSDFISFGYDFQIAGNGTVGDASEFYTNLHANFPGNENSYGNCKFDYVPIIGTPGSFTSYSFDAGTAPNRVRGAGCPTTLAGMPAGSTIFFMAVNVGDTSTNDTGLAGYFDNVVLTGTQAATTFDFEPYIANPDVSKFMSSEKYVRAGNSSDIGAAVQVPAEATDVRFDFDGAADYTNVAGYEHIQAGQWPKANGSHQYRVGTALAPGEYLVTAEYKVGANWYGVTGSATTFSIDSPWAQYIIPSASQFFRPNDMVARVKVDDEYDQFKSMNTVINGVKTTVDRSDCSDKGSYVLCDVRGLNLPEGKYSAVTTTYTKASNRVDNLVSELFTIDGTKPELTNLHVINPASVYGDSVDVSADATDDDGSGIKDVRFYVTAPRSSDGACDGNGAHLISALGVSGAGSTYSTTLDTSSLNGDYCINAIAGDVAANHSAISRMKVSFDNTAPSQPDAAYSEDSSSDPVSSGGYTDSQYFTFKLSNPAGEGIDHYELKYWNDIAGSQFKENSPWKKNNIPSSGEYKDNFTQGEGEHYFAFRACDAAKNCSEYGEPFTVKYDITAPAVTITSPQKGTLYVPGPITIQGTVDDPDVDTVAVTFNGDTQDATPDAAGNWSTIFSSVVAGQYDVTALAYDAAGNPGSATLADVVVDTVAPAIVVRVPEVTRGTFTAAAAQPAQVFFANNFVNTPTTNQVQDTGDTADVLADETTAPPSEVRASETNVVADTTADDDGCWDILGLCWYWWVVIVAGIMALIYITRRLMATNKN